MELPYVEIHLNLLIDCTAGFSVTNGTASLSRYVSSDFEKPSLSSSGLPEIFLGRFIFLRRLW